MTGGTASPSDADAQPQRTTTPPTVGLVASTCDNLTRWQCCEHNHVRCFVGSDKSSRLLAESKWWREQAARVAA